MMNSGFEGKTNLGNEYVFDLTSYEKPNLIFELENLEIPNHAKQLTLQLYHFSGTAGEIVSYEQKESEDAYIEEIWNRIWRKPGTGRSGGSGR